MVENISWQIEELQKLISLQPVKIDEALQRLWKVQPDLHRLVVINAYLCEKISLAKAAEEIGTTRLELERELKRRGIPIRRATAADAVAEVGAIVEW